MWAYSEKIVVHQQGSRPSPDIQSADAFILDFLASRIVSNKFLFLSYSGILLQQPEWTKTTRLSLKSTLKVQYESMMYLNKICMWILCKDIQICGLDLTSFHFLRDLVPPSPCFFLPAFSVFLHWLLTFCHYQVLPILKYKYHIWLFSTALQTSCLHHSKPHVVSSSPSFTYCFVEVYFNGFQAWSHPKD